MMWFNFICEFQNSSHLKWKGEKNAHTHTPHTHTETIIFISYMRWNQHNKWIQWIYNYIDETIYSASAIPILITFRNVYNVFVYSNIISATVVAWILFIPIVLYLSVLIFIWLFICLVSNLYKLFDSITHIDV